MTLEELQRLSDKELIELCATKVMGWEPDRKSSTGRVLYWQGGEKTFIHFQPLTDWNHTMEVVGKVLKNHGWHGRNGFLLTTKQEEDGGNWYCEFPQPKWEYAEDIDPRRAICLAALLAVQ